MQPVERSDPEGVDYGWVMQTTFVLTILFGSPVVAALSTTATLPTWGARAEFAVRVCSVIWLLVAPAVYLYARRIDAGDTESLAAGGAAPGDSEGLRPSGSRKSQTSGDGGSPNRPLAAGADGEEERRSSGGRSSSNSGTDPDAVAED